MKHAFRFQITCFYLRLSLGIWGYFVLSDTATVHFFWINNDPFLLRPCQKCMTNRSTWTKEALFIITCCTKHCDCFTVSRCIRSLVMSNIHLNRTISESRLWQRRAQLLLEDTQTTSRGSLSAFDTTTATLSGRRTASLSLNTDRKPRSLLLWSLRMTLVPFATASSTSWWDISPEQRIK